MGPEIDRLTRSSDALAAERGLRPGLRDHVSAFRAFWEGDYEGARAEYRAILESDSTDVEAWLLLGAVEFEDPWLVELQDGSLRPRKSLNLARTSFETAARLAPELPLSYGHLFEIDRIVAEAVIQGECPAYERPGGDLFPPFANRVAEDQVAFCPVPEDSIRWVPLDDYAESDRAGHVHSTRQMLAETSTLLERWIAVRPDQARPHEEWADFTLWERNLADCTADPERVDSLTALALGHMERALELRGDTTSEDRVRLAILRLAADDIAGSEQLMETALGVYHPALLNGPPAPTAAADLYLATGRPDRAHTILRPIWDGRTFGTMDPDEADAVLMAGPVEPQFGRLLVYGAAGVTGASLDSLFDSIEEVWAEPEFTRRQRAALSHASLFLGIGPALAASPAVLERWVGEWLDAELEVPAALIGLAAVQSGSGSAADWLDSTIVQLEASDRVSASRLFLAATLAARTGHDSLAAELFGRVPACPPGLDSVDLAWGLRTQSHLFQGLALQAIGDLRAAAGASREAALRWQSAEATLAPAARLAAETADQEP
jgi:tetratricopeptide (TPR) repeat protein